MNKKFFRLISALMAVAVVLSLMTGCGSSQTKSQSTTSGAASGTNQQTASTPEPLKEVTLKFYFGGTKLTATDEVWNAVSEAYKDKLNAKFEINYIPWGDLVNKIMVMGAAGDQWDMNFTADWMGYAQLLNAGCFKPLNDLLPKYAPDLYAKYQSLGTLEAATANGNIMCLPWTMKQNTRPYISWRRDLSPEIARDSVKTIEDVDTLLANAKAKFPTLRTINMGTQDGFPFPVGKITALKYELSDLAFHGFYFDINDSSVKVVPFEQTQAFKEAVTYAKKWYDAGFIAKDALVDKNDINTYADNGKVYASIGWNESVLVGYDRAEKGLNSYKALRGEYSELYPDKKFINRSPLANVFAIGRNAENPERALMLCNLMETDKNLYDMVMYGIKDKTYVLDGDAATLPSGMTPATSTYMGWTSQWPFWKPQFMRPDSNYGAGFWQKQAEFASLPVNINSPVDGLFFNGDSIKTELAKRDQLQDETAKPLLFGVCKNIDKEVADYIAAQKAAGTDKIVAELQKQVDAFLAAKKK